MGSKSLKDFTSEVYRPVLPGCQHHRQSCPLDIWESRELLLSYCCSLLIGKHADLSLVKHRLQTGKETGKYRKTWAEIRDESRWMHQHEHRLRYLELLRKKSYELMKNVKWKLSRGFNWMSTYSKLIRWYHCDSHRCDSFDLLSHQSWHSYVWEASCKKSKMFHRQWSSTKGRLSQKYWDAAIREWQKMLRGCQENKS